MWIWNDPKMRKPKMKWEAWIEDKSHHTEEKVFYFLSLSHHRSSQIVNEEGISSICLFQTPKVPEDKGLYWCNSWFGSSNTRQVTGQKSLTLTFSESHKKGRHLMKKKVILLNSSSLSLHPSFFFSFPPLFIVCLSQASQGSIKDHYWIQWSF